MVEEKGVWYDMTDKTINISIVQKQFGLDWSLGG